MIKQGLLEFVPILPLTSITLTLEELPYLGFFFMTSKHKSKTVSLRLHKMFCALPEAKPTPLKISKHRFNSDSSQGDLSARILAAVNAVLLVLPFGSVMD